MTSTTRIFAYRAFGYTISSEIPLPELPSIKLENRLADITVKKTDLTNLWSELSSEDNYFVVKENLVMFRVPEKAIFLIQNGNEICVSPITDLYDKYHRLFILGTCMGAILMQRKVLPLHGSAVAIDGRAYAIVGDSGAGKSTLASAFLSKGYQLLSDDVIPVTFSSGNVPIVIPAYPQQKLWMESLEQFGMDSDEYELIVERETKFAVPITNQFVNQPLPLAGIFELKKTEEDDISLIQITNMQRFYTLFTHTYRNFFLAEAGLMDWHFATSAKMVNHLSIYKLKRPISRFTAHELVDVILSTITNKEANIQ
ncbi:aldolase [Peribacillus asahii]|uniref:aldolase n=1 Tax=Peribacillus asahii TaxID=228899 RepID=UPI0037F5F445